MELDVEMFYILAHRLLNLAYDLLPAVEREKLRQEPTLQKIRSIRNNLIQHAYDDLDTKPAHDPYGGFGWGEKEGIQVKAGSSKASSIEQDPGYFAIEEAFNKLLSRYDIPSLAIIGSTQKVLG
jgi:hypothetical protein